MRNLVKTLLGDLALAIAAGAIFVGLIWLLEYVWRTYALGMLETFPVSDVRIMIDSGLIAGALMLTYLIFDEMRNP